MMRRLISFLVACTASLTLNAQTWGNIEYTGRPWVENVSRPYHITRGLDNRHLSIWASHGRYYDNNEDRWRWQRPTLFCTNEDLFTQTIVVPFLIPMLERAGAVVYTPRERDWQRYEVIVDNDDHHRLVGYLENGFKHPWQDTGLPGFAWHSGSYKDGEQPFTAGTARMAATTQGESQYSNIIYQPDIPEAGRYAVYVSYQTVAGSIDDAHYTVWHKGEQTEFRVNQRMGGGTWVYLGTFDFDAGCNQWNCVVLTNQSGHHGVVTADAVRFGGGMGNIERGGKVSGLPRCLEGARYYCQWAGFPFRIYSTRKGQNDYADDINTRSLSSNMLAGGSCFVPDSMGRGVPIELSLAVHSDAGYHQDGRSVYGALTIHTSVKDSSHVFKSGRPRSMSGELATELLNNIDRDVNARYGFNWIKREVRNRNYSETRLPEVPSSIFEVMSHQSFPDMRYGQDPNFKFTMARSIYKTILRYTNRNHDRSYVVTPLTPARLKIEYVKRKRGDVRLSWLPVDDPQEPTARPTGYIVYTAVGSGDFNNGEYVEGTSYNMRLEPGVLYSFRVTAVNRGGESFPTEVVSALHNHRKSKTVLVINGFHRLSSPAYIDNDSLQGFLLNQDMGVSYGRTAGWTGQQTVFDKSKMGIENATGLGYGGTELAGQFFAGNEFNYIRTHAEAIRRAGYYNVMSCSADVVSSLDPEDYDAVDLILGLECNDGRSLLMYKSFPEHLQSWLASYARQGGALLVSGAYLASDMTSQDEQVFMDRVLKCHYAGKSLSPGETINGMGTTFNFYRRPNEQHYAAQQPDILQPADGAMPVMAYDDNYCAATVYRDSRYAVFAMGFPFECIQADDIKASVMQAILAYIIKK